MRLVTHEKAPYGRGAREGIGVGLLTDRNSNLDVAVAEAVADAVGHVVR